jgi:hypothetical protein
VRRIGHGGGCREPEMARLWFICSLAVGFSAIVGSDCKETGWLKIKNSAPWAYASKFCFRGGGDGVLHYWVRFKANGPTVGCLCSMCWASAGLTLLNNVCCRPLCTDSRGSYSTTHMTCSIRSIERLSHIGRATTAPPKQPLRSACERYLIQTVRAT